jgi:hypothetical protein
MANPPGYRIKTTRSRRRVKPLAKSAEDTKTIMPTVPTAPEGQRAHMPNTYEAVVRQTLIALGSNDPDIIIRNAGEFMKNCHAAGVDAKTCAATMYGSERHRHEVGRTTVNEGASENMAAAPTRGEWEVVVRRTGSMDKILHSAGRKPDEVRGSDVIFGEFYDDEKAASFARKMTKAGFVAWYGPRRKVEAAEEGVQSQIAARGILPSGRTRADVMQLLEIRKSIPTETIFKHRVYEEDIPVDALPTSTVMKAAPVKTIDPRGLIAKQEKLDTNAVRLYMAGGKPTAGFSGDVTVLDVGGHRYILDGTHRTAAAILKGEQIEAHVVSGTAASEVGLCEGDASAMGASEVAPVIAEANEAAPVIAESGWRKVARDPATHEADMKLAKKYGAIQNPEKVYELAGPELSKEDAEVFLVIPLNLRGELKSWPIEVARGQRSRVTVGVGDVMRAVVVSGCEGFIVCHNHPSGRCQPSKADRQLTEQIKKATAPFGNGVKFLDHVVVASRQCYSIVEDKMYPARGKFKS